MSKTYEKSRTSRHSTRRCASIAPSSDQHLASRCPLSIVDRQSAIINRESLDRPFGDAQHFFDGGDAGGDLFEAVLAQRDHAAASAHAAKLGDVGVARDLVAQV